MPLDLDTVIEMVPVDTGDMTDIPPDMPAGAWIGTITVKNTSTKEKKQPMLILNFTAEEALSDGNEDFTGSKAAVFLVFKPEHDPASKFGKIEIKKLCDAYDIDPPDTSSLPDGNFTSLQPFVEALEDTKRPFWTTIETDKSTGEKRTKIHYTEPGKKLKAVKRDDDEEEEEEDAAPVPVPTPIRKSGVAAKKVASGKRR
jgi:hypothetical protein